MNLFSIILFNNCSTVMNTLLLLWYLLYKKNISYIIRYYCLLHWRLWYIFSGSRHCHRPDDDHVWTWTSDRFQQTIHVAGNQYYDQEAHQTETRCLQLFEPAEQRDLGVRGLLVHRCIHRTFYRVQVNGNFSAVTRVTRLSKYGRYMVRHEAESTYVRLMPLPPWNCI